MEPRGAALRTGLFVIGAIAVLIGLIFVLSGDLFSPGVRYESYFHESVQGLDIGSAVKFRGVTIGKVTEIGLVSAEYPPANPNELNRKIYHQVVVRYRINPSKLGRGNDIREAIKHGLRIQVAPQGITGLAYLELSFQTPPVSPPQTVPWVPHSMVIPSVPSTLTEVQDAVQGFLANMRHVRVDQIVKTLGALIGAVHDELTTGDAHKALANLNTLLVEMQGQLKQADLPGTTASLRTLSGGEATKAILDRLARTTAALARATAAMPTLIADSQTTVRNANATTASLQRQMIPIMQSLKQASANLQELTETLKRNPSVILHGTPPPRTTP